MFLWQATGKKQPDHGTFFLKGYQAVGFIYLIDVFLNADFESPPHNIRLKCFPENY